MPSPILDIHATRMSEKDVFVQFTTDDKYLGGVDMQMDLYETFRAMIAPKEEPRLKYEIKLKESDFQMWEKGDK